MFNNNKKRQKRKEGPGRQKKEKVLPKGQMSIDEAMDIDYY